MLVAQWGQQPAASTMRLGRERRAARAAQDWGFHGRQIQIRIGIDMEKTRSVAQRPAALLTATPRRCETTLAYSSEFTICAVRPGIWQGAFGSDRTRLMARWTGRRRSRCVPARLSSNVVDSAACRRPAHQGLGGLAVDGRMRVAEARRRSTHSHISGSRSAGSRVFP